jgi:hypothetical protein
MGKRWVDGMDVEWLLPRLPRYCEDLMSGPLFGNGILEGYSAMTNDGLFFSMGVLFYAS